MKSNKQTFPFFLEQFAQKFFILGIGIHLIMLLSLRAGFLNPLFDDSTHRVGQGADFYAIYQAGQNVIDGVSIYLKSPPTLVVPYFYVYRYLPFSAYTFGQFFRLFSPQIAYVLWVLILETLLFLNLKLTRKIFTNSNQAKVAMSLWLLFSPYYLELYMGQFSFFMATLYFWMIYYWTSKKEVRGDAVWTLSLLVKTNSALFVPVLLKMKKWKSLLVAMSVVVLLSVPYFLSMPGTFHEFAWNFTEALSVETIAGNQGFAALLSVTLLRFGGHWVSDINQFFQNIDMTNAIVRTPLLVWSVIIFGISLLLTLRTSATYATELFLMWILSYFLTYKHVWEHHYVMMFPVFLFLYRHLAERRNAVVLSPKIFWSAFVVIALPTPFIFIDKIRVLVDPEFYWSTAESMAFHFAKPFAALVLYTALVFSLWKYSKQAPAPKTERTSTPIAEAA